MKTQLLERIAIALEAMAPKEPLGFDVGNRRTIHCSRKNDPLLWYLWDGAQGEAVGLGGSLRCYIEGVDIYEGEYKGKPTYKLRVFVKADQPYILSSGLDTLWSKSLVNSLMALSDEQLKQPVTIIPKAGDEEGVMFAIVYSGGNPVRTENECHHSEFMQRVNTLAGWQPRLKPTEQASASPAPPAAVVEAQYVKSEDLDDLLETLKKAGKTTQASRRAWLRAQGVQKADAITPAKLLDLEQAANATCKEATAYAASVADDLAEA